MSNSLRALLSLALARGRWDAVAVGAAAAIAAVGISVWARDGAARGRLRRALPWVGWGLAWFALASGTLALVHPLWCPDRTPYGAIGAGVAVAAGLGALRPALVAVLFALRLALLAAAPAPPRSITVAAPASGAFVDFAHLARLQRLMRATRERVADAGPLPRGARVVWRNFPLESVYAFGGSRALQVWGGDSTLRWVRFAEFERNPALDVATIVEYEPDRSRQIARVDPEVMRSFLAADRPMREGDLALALQRLDRADSLQQDPEAASFRAGIAETRAVCLGGLGRLAGAEREARRALSLTANVRDARYDLALIALDRGRTPKALAQLDTPISHHPEDDEGPRAARAGATA